MISRRDLFLGLLALTLGGLFLAYWGISYFVMNAVTAVQPRCERHTNEYSYTPAQFERENFDTTPYFMETFEAVTFPSREEGIEISGWFIPNQAGEADTIYPTVIIAHGFNDCKHRPQSLTPAGMLSHNGFNTLVMDLRDHGDSTIEDGRAAAGTDEFWDVLGAWDWLQSEKGIPAEKIGVYGYSMGGASVLIAAGEEPQITAVWSDSAFSNFENVIDFQLSRNNLPAILKIGVILSHELITNDRWSAITPAESATKLQGRPLYLVHGEKDQTVPFEEMAILAEAHGADTQTWALPETAHIEAIFDAADEYQSRLLEFFGNALNN